MATEFIVRNKKYAEQFNGAYYGLSMSCDCSAAAANRIKFDTAAEAFARARAPHDGKREVFAVTYVLRWCDTYGELTSIYADEDRAMSAYRDAHRFNTAAEARAFDPAFMARGFRAGWRVFRRERKVRID